MKKIIDSLILVLTLVFGLSLTSCNEDPEPSRTYFMNIVTFGGEQAGTSTFLLQTGPQTPEIELTAKITFSTPLQIGQRIVIAYYTPDNQFPTTHTSIELIQAGYVENGSAQILPADSLSNWENYPTYLVGMTRTGKYVNIETRINSSPTDQHFRLIADEATINNPVPDLYLVNCTQLNPVVSVSTYYASFDISGILDLSHVEGVRIHVANSNITSSKVFGFMKDATSPEASPVPDI